MDNYKYLKYKKKYNNLKNKKTNLVGGAQLPPQLPPPQLLPPPPPQLPQDEELNVQVRLDEIGWVPARDYQLMAFTEFNRLSRRYSHEYRYDYNNEEEGIKFTIKRINHNLYGGIYMIREDTTITPIADWNAVKVFLLDIQPVEWYSARDYQTWAYFDFIYSSDNIRKYKSRGTIYGNNGVLLGDDYIEIPIDGLDEGIIFSMSRNENGTIFYQKDDTEGTRVRISDNEYARRQYYGFYRRMTDSSGIFISHAPVVHSTRLSLPCDIEVSQTLNEDIMCVICNDNKQNIRFQTCNHTNTCSECYLRLHNSRQCPICKQVISTIIKYTPIDV